MRDRLPQGRALYFTLLGALAAICIGVGAALLLFPAGDAGDAPAYVLKDHAGHLALYAADGSGPLAEYDVYTRLLPEQDLLALQQGVAVADEQELQRRLEDYGL